MTGTDAAATLGNRREANMPTVIETPRLRLREMTRDDLDFLSEMLGDGDVMRYYPQPLDRAGAQAWLERQLERYERDGFGFWLVEDPVTGQAIGQVGLLKQTVEGDVHREVAYMIHRPYQRNGFATEAATAVRDHAFEVLKMMEVVSFIRPENLPSQRVARRLGMEPRRTITHSGLRHLIWSVRAVWAPMVLGLLACGGEATRAGTGAATRPYSFGSCGASIEGSYGTSPVRSLHVPMRDGVRIALDVLLPDGLPEGARVPTILTMTRYWRAWQGDEPNEMQRFFTSHGYAVVWGDSRGTGASFGVWPHHRSPDEVLDFGEVMDWIVAQPWSDGTVGGWGTSYTANTNDWFAQVGRSSFRAGISRFPDYDPYADLYFPGGVPNAYMGSNWGLRVKDMDLNLPQSRGDAPAVGVRPVDADADGSLVAAAVEARRDVPSVWESFRILTYKDEPMPLWGGLSMDDWGIHSHAGEVEASGSAIYSWASWTDAGTAQGVLHRFMTLSNPQRAVIAAWSHGAREDASPFHPEDHPLDPPTVAQRLEDLCFYEEYLRVQGPPVHELVYRTMGEDAWKRTSQWPLPEAREERWYLGEDGLLSPERPESRGTDRYEVDFTHTTGRRNRWATNNGAGDVVYPDRAEADTKLLVYTSPPLDRALEVTGTPVVTLRLGSTHEDGAVFVYLEDVAPDGRVLYIGEGQIRLLHRKSSDASPPFVPAGPYHSYRRADAAPMTPGKVEEVTFAMLPTSVLFRAGHRIRIAIGGADADTFARIPAEGSPVWTVERGGDARSYVTLPVIPRGSGDPSER